VRGSGGGGVRVKTEIQRDKWGIAHVKAPNQPAAFEAQGWIAASDRIWQMEFDRLKSQGRWGETVGAKAAREDAFFRRLGLADLAKQHWSSLASETKAITEAYARGVNRWLDTHEDELPAEFEYHAAAPEQWQPWHCVAVYKLRHIFMGTLNRKLWRGFLLAKGHPDLLQAMRGSVEESSAITTSNLPATELADLSDLIQANADQLRGLVDIDGGSNSWAIAGSRTESGLPLLAGDPHRGIEFPNVYHQFHMKCPEFNAIGLAFPGVPGFPHFGHNADVAWCITHGMADDTDLFLETEDLAGVQWSSETLSLRGEGSFEVYRGSTQRGPVVLGDPSQGAALSMAWTGMNGQDSTFDALLPMLKASTCEELEAAVEPWVIPVNNLLSADRDGHISFKVRGRVIERPHENRWIPVSAETSVDWSNLDPVSFEDLPGERDPDRGYLVTANNRISDGGPYISLDFAGPARYDRIVELIEALPNATAADMEKIHSDVVSLRAPAIVGALVTHVTQFTHPSGQWLVDCLTNWDCALSEESIEASLYSVIRRRWTESVGERLGVGSPELGGPKWPSPEAASRMLAEAAIHLLVDENWHLVPGLESEDDLDAALSSCIDETLEELEQRLGEDNSQWTWGRLHRMASPHPLASAVEQARHLHPPIDACPGDSDTVRCGSVTPETGERSAAGSVARYVFDLDDWDRSGWVVPHGVSGVRGEGHDIDQRATWLDCALIPMAFTPSAVKEIEVECFEI
tara:strand:+ start:41640 stop:43877 length:2238 start_codon:yes stop_codon:yes gene_type:complete